MAAFLILSFRVWVLGLDCQLSDTADCALLNRLLFPQPSIIFQPICQP